MGTVDCRTSGFRSKLPMIEPGADERSDRRLRLAVGHERPSFHKGSLFFGGPGDARRIDVQPELLEKLGRRDTPKARASFAFFQFGGELSGQALGADRDGGDRLATLPWGVGRARPGPGLAKQDRAESQSSKVAITLQAFNSQQVSDILASALPFLTAGDTIVLGRHLPNDTPDIVTLDHWAEELAPHLPAVWN